MKIIDHCGPEKIPFVSRTDVFYAKLKYTYNEWKIIFVKNGVEHTFSRINYFILC